MSRKIELLAPGGDTESIKAAIAAGANAIYCGLNKFNARNRAENITFDRLNGILRLAHQHDCQIFLTLNISIVESEIPDLIRLLNKLVNTRIDGVIIQDLGLFYLLKNHFPSLDIHASTQLTTHNKGQLKFLKALTASRVNLSRELNLSEIKALTTAAHQNNLLTEVFVHGSYCLSFSGICYMSSLHGGNSGNRGRCSQPCRDEYLVTPAGKQFPLNLKDNSAYFDLEQMANAGVDSMKIEGRIKQFHYVYTVVDAYQKQLKRYYSNQPQNKDNSALYKVFNRNFSNGFLTGDIHKKMFIENPRDYSATHLAAQNGGTSQADIDEAEQLLYQEKGTIRAVIKTKTDRYSIEQAPLTIRISGQANKPLKIEIETPEDSFVLFSASHLASRGNMPLDREMLYKRLKAINETEYQIKQIDLQKLQPNLYLPFKELTAIKNQILYRIKGSKEAISPVELPPLKHQNKKNIKPTLSVLINDEQEINLCQTTTATIFFQLPSCFHKKKDHYISLFQKHANLLPWFPSVLIGEDYRAAVHFLQNIPTRQIVANNSGIAFEAYQMDIPWIAGPFFNLVNSYGLLCLKEEFNCLGAFLSNELNQQQLRGIKKPEDFSLYYSIYHPIILMTSRQCLFHQVTACHKERIDQECIHTCKQSATITNLKRTAFVINKSPGNYHTIYNETHFLNTAIATDIPDRFSGFMIDLRNIPTKTQTDLDRSSIIQLFENHLKEQTASAQQLHQHIQPTTNKQYIKGI